MAPRVARAGRRRGRGASYLLALSVAAACDRAGDVREFFQPATPHEAYVAALRAAGLDRTALGADWIAAAQQALSRPVHIEAPFREVGYLAPERPMALGYRFDLPGGRRITVEVERSGEDLARIFPDLFRLVGDSARTPRRVASADSTALRLEYETRRGGAFLLRIQPELLRGGRYTLTILTDASLAFPVEGVDHESIRSVFGDPRDGGSRDHHGIDIFAPRGTPVIALAEGTIAGVRTTRLGGKVVWLRDSRRGQSLYYAHLDTQLVVEGQTVRPGDTLGLVGNTGNARTTPPHLHFGVYRRGEGPVDPWPFVVPVTGHPPDVAADTSVLGRWTRTARNGLRLRAAPDARAPSLAVLPLHTAMRVLGASGRWYRVHLPDGTAGYVEARLTEVAESPVREQAAIAAAPLLARPRPDAPVVDSLTPGAPLPILGRFGKFLMVRAADGIIGWLPAG
ncbi:MAG TPA: M23 family metallopeptidase [Longimicrobiales bacterium]